MARIKVYDEVNTNRLLGTLDVKLSCDPYDNFPVLLPMMSVSAYVAMSARYVVRNDPFPYITLHTFHTTEVSNDGWTLTRRYALKTSATLAQLCSSRLFRPAFD